MAQLFYILKIGILTFLLVVFMQIEVGQNTIENHADRFIKKSGFMEPVREIAKGGFIVLKNGYRSAVATIDSLVTTQFRAENSPGKRKILELKRSLAFEKLLKEKPAKEDEIESEDSESL